MQCSLLYLFNRTIDRTIGLNCNHFRIDGMFVLSSVLALGLGTLLVPVKDSETQPYGIWNPSQKHLHYEQRGRPHQRRNEILSE